MTPTCRSLLGSWGRSWYSAPWAVRPARRRRKLIQSEGVAFNRIDLEAARERGVYVCNNKGCNADSVAEHTVMLMLMALRHGITGHSAVREGRQMQMKEAVMASNSPELGEQTVGLVGLGDRPAAETLRMQAVLLHPTPPAPGGGGGAGGDLSAPGGTVLHL